MKILVILTLQAQILQGGDNSEILPNPIEGTVLQLIVECSC